MLMSGVRERDDIGKYNIFLLEVVLMYLLLR